MKLKTALLAGILAFGASSTAQAQDPAATADNTINITGSTAFRSAAHSGILAALQNETYAYTGTSGPGSASAAIYAGNLGAVDGPFVYIRTRYNGSTDGINALAAQTTLSFVSTDTNVQARSGGGTASASSTVNDTADFAFSDVERALSNFPDPNTPVLTGGRAAVIPFRWFASALVGDINTDLGWPGHTITNMTDQLALRLYSAGQLEGGMFTGLSADNPNDDLGAPQALGFYCLPFGRDPGSGTRATMLSEIGFNARRNVNQYGGSGQVDPGSGNAVALVNAGTLSNGGLSSGGTLKNFVGATTASVTVNGNAGQRIVAIGYTGVNDGNGAVTQGAKELTYNGVPYSQENVKRGAYTFWGYLQLYGKQTLSNEETTFNSLIRTQLLDGAVLGANGVSLNDMKVTRSGGDGGPVSFGVLAN